MRKPNCKVKALIIASIFGWVLACATSISAQPTPQHGVLVTWYSDELFLNWYSTQTNQTVNQSGKFFTGTGNFSGIFEGYISVTNTATYDLQLEAAAHGEFQFDGALVGNPLVPTGACSSSPNETNSVYSRTLVAGQYYPFRIRLLTGCYTYFYRAYLKWRPSSDTNFAIIPGSSLYMNNPTAITNITPSIHTAVEIYWPTATNKQYVVQRASNLNTNWQTFTPVYLGDGNTNSAFDSTRSVEKQFYRVLSW